MKKFECRRCGHCCITNYVLPLFSIDDWKPIINFLKEKYHGVLSITCDCGCSLTSKFKIESIDDIKKAIENRNDLFWALDYGKCPFFKKNEDGTIECEIYEIRPSVCRNYQCNMTEEETNKKRKNVEYAIEEEEYYKNHLKDNIWSILKYDDLFERYVNDPKHSMLEHYRNILLLSWNWDFVYIKEEYKLKDNEKIDSINALKDLIDIALENKALFDSFLTHIITFKVKALAEIFKLMKIEFDI